VISRISTIVLVASAAAVHAAQAPASPADWLPTNGRNRDWVEATATCRERLGKLKADAPLVSKHLPVLKEKVDLLRRVDSFDWKSRTAIDFAEDMLADLNAGREPFRRYAGKGVAFPYWSDAANMLQAIWVHVPPGYDPAKTCQFFMYYKCGGGIHFKDGRAQGGYRPSVEVANQTDTFHAWSSLHIQVKGRMCVDRELEEATSALAKVFAIDLDRIFLSGWSDGGFTAVWLASRYPHLVAGIAPCCANWQYANAEQIGLFNVPMLAVDGWGDGGYNSSQFRRWHALHTMGYDVAGLWGHHGHAYTPYEDAEEFTRILEWAKTKRRDLWPRRVRYATWNLAWHRAYWFSIERMIDPSLAAQIDAQVKDGNRIDVSAWNVAAYKLALSGKLVDPEKPVTVATNGKESYAGPFRPELAIELVKQPGKFVKSAEMPGGIVAQVTRSTYGARGYLKIADRPWLWVKPTGGDAETLKLLAKWAPEWAMADTELTDADMAGHSLFVYGGPDVNRLTARIAADLPVKFAKGSFTIGRRVYDQPTACVQFIHPNPLSPKRYVIVAAFNDAAAFAENGFFETQSVSAWKLRSGDGVVMGVPAAAPRWSVAAEDARFEKHHVIFDANWRAPDETPLGELEAPFSYTQILRLRADAIREATGADVGLIGEHTPGWNRWRASLPAGPVTVHDIATLEMLPEYVTLFDASGQALAEMVARSAASSALTDKRDPSYDPKSSLVLSELDPEKTYRVAMGYYGLPAYGAEPSKMPKLYFFRSPEEFLAGGHTSLPARNMRQSPIEVTEAVARTIRRRESVAPRKVCFDLTEYIMNPEANEFGACDWLHVGFDGDWQALQGGGARPFRYTLHLGLRAAAAPPLAPPRSDSKKFVDLLLTGRERRVEFNLAALGTKLPVAATLDVKDLVVAGAEGPSFRLVDAPEAKGVVARAALIDVRLTNKGAGDVVAVAVVVTTALMRVHPSVLEVPEAKGEPRSYVGILPDFAKPTRVVVRLLAPGSGTPEAMVLPNAGWNFGLIGLKEELTVKAGATVSLPLLFIAAHEPAESKAKLSLVLEALKSDILTRLSILPTE